MNGALFGVASLLLLLPAAGQTPAGALSGTLLDSVTGQPLAKAEVRLLGGPGPGQPPATTDEHGEFRFENVAPGRYRLLARQQGYQRTTLGATPEDAYGRVLAVSAAGLSGVEYRLPPLSVLQGRVVNADGEPVAGAVVVAGVVDAYGAPPSLEPVRAVTDANGEYRSAVLPQGRYYVQVIPPLARTGAQAVDLPAFFPSVGRFSEAVPITVNAGDFATRTNITLRRAPVFQVRGALTGSGAGYSAFTLTVTPDADSAALQHLQGYVDAFTQRAQVKLEPDGRFEIGALEAGTYEARVGRGGAADPLVRRVFTVTDRDVEELNLNLAAALRITIRLEAEPAAKDVRCRVNIVPAAGDVGLGGISGEATLERAFVVEGVAPADYGLRAMCRPQEWIVESAQLGAGPGAREVTRVGLQLGGVSGAQQVALRLTRATGSAAITVKDGETPAPGRTVTLIPATPTLGSFAFLATVGAGDDGKAVAQNLAPGEYRACAWRSGSIAQSPMYPEFLKRFEAQCALVTVKAGQTTQAQTATVQP